MATLKKQAGDFGERLARRYLEDKGYQFVAANWSCKTGEIDLIMRARQPSDCLVFVEVRLRRPTQYGAGFETVAREKQRKIIRTAKYYVQKENYWGDVRFDVVSIVNHEDGEPEVDHIEWAFEAE